MKKKYFECVVEGHYNTLKGYMEGFITGSGKDLQYFFGNETGIKTETFSEILKEWVTLGHKIHHVIMEEELLNSIREVLANSKETALLNQNAIKSAKEIKEASFAFEFTAFGQKYGEEIKSLLENKPESLSLHKYKPSEKIDHDSKGVEMYAPSHEYELKGNGIITGSIDEIISYRTLMDNHPLIEVEKIELVF